MSRVRSGPVLDEWKNCIVEGVLKESPEAKYRPSEWVRTKMPFSQVDTDAIPDPKKPEHLFVKLKDLQAVQYLVNKPTMFYYVHLMRDNVIHERPVWDGIENIRVKPFAKKFIVINGTHRVEAYRYMGIESIPATRGWWL